MKILNISRISLILAYILVSLASMFCANPIGGGIITVEVSSEPPIVNPLSYVPHLFSSSFISHTKSSSAFYASQVGTPWSMLSSIYYGINPKFANEKDEFSEALTNFKEAFTKSKFIIKVNTKPIRGVGGKEVVVDFSNLSNTTHLEFYTMGSGGFGAAYMKQGNLYFHANHQKQIVINPEFANEILGDKAVNTFDEKLESLNKIILKVNGKPVKDLNGKDLIIDISILFGYARVRFYTVDAKGNLGAALTKEGNFYFHTTIDKFVIVPSFAAEILGDMTLKNFKNAFNAKSKGIIKVKGEPAKEVNLNGKEVDFSSISNDAILYYYTLKHDGVIGMVYFTGGGDFYFSAMQSGETGEFSFTINPKYAKNITEPKVEH